MAIKCCINSSKSQPDPELSRGMLASETKIKSTVENKITKLLLHITAL